MVRDSEDDYQETLEFLSESSCQRSRVRQVLEDTKDLLPSALSVYRTNDQEFLADEHTTKHDMREITPQGVVFMMLFALLILANTIGLANCLPTSHTHVNVKRGSGKAGISWPQQERSAVPIEKFFGNGTSELTWWWNWNKNYGIDLFTYDVEQASIDADFIPMQYDTAMLFNRDPLQSGWAEIMGYNEPDLFTLSGVSVPLEVNVAGDNWRTMLATLRQDNPQAKFWSPSVAWNKDWLSGFFGYICPDGLKGCEWAPDYLTIHVYNTDVEGFKKQVTDYHDQFGLDIVISEYACYLFDGSDPQPNLQTVSNFMSETTAWLDETPWIHKYAWFGTVRDKRWLWGVAETNRLMDASGAMTDLGRQYVAGGHTSMFGVNVGDIRLGLDGIWEKLATLGSN